jgi:hypothetical protein
LMSGILLFLAGRQFSSSSWLFFGFPFPIPHIYFICSWQSH